MFDIKYITKVRGCFALAVGAVLSSERNAEILRHCACLACRRWRCRKHSGPFWRPSASAHSSTRLPRRHCLLTVPNRRTTWAPDEA